MSDNQNKPVNEIINIGFIKKDYEALNEGVLDTIKAACEKPIVKAVQIGNMLVCGDCGHKIAGCKSLRMGLGNGTIYLKCRHKDRSKKCNVLNEIEL